MAISVDLLTQSVFVSCGLNLVTSSQHREIRAETGTRKNIRYEKNLTPWIKLNRAIAANRLLVKVIFKETGTGNEVKLRFAFRGSSNRNSSKWSPKLVFPIRQKGRSLPKHWLRLRNGPEFIVSRVNHPLRTSRMPTLTLLSILTSSFGTMVAAVVFPSF